MILSHIEEYFTQRLQTVQFAGATIQVYPFLPEREHKELILPAFAFKRHEIFVRDNDVQIASDVVFPGHLSITGTIAGPFDIVEGENDTISMLVGSNTYTITIPAGDISAVDISTLINNTIDYVLASSSSGKLRITSSLAYQGMAILACDNDAYTTLGIPSDWVTEGELAIDSDYHYVDTVGGYDSYTFRAHPSPVDILYEVQTLASKKAHSDYLQEAMYQVFPPGIRPEIRGQYPVICYGKPVNMDELEKPFFRSAYMLEVCGVWIDRIETTEYKSAQSIGMILTPTEDVNG